MQEAEQSIIWCPGDWSHSPCPLRASGTKATLWSATGCDIYGHFHRLWVASHPNATWEFLGVISSCFYLSFLICYFNVLPLASEIIWKKAVYKTFSNLYVISNFQVGITTLEEDSCVINDKPEDITATLARQRPNWPPGERVMTSWWYETYRHTYNIRRTIHQNLNVSRLVLLLSLTIPLKPGVPVGNEDVFGAAPTGAAPTTSEMTSQWC